MIETLQASRISKFEGLHHVKSDKKSRIVIPSEWRGLFGNSNTVFILDAGSSLLIVPEGCMELQESDMIFWRSEIDSAGRILISLKMLQSIGKHLPKSVGLIGRGNHIELYIDEEMLNKTLAASRKCVETFQRKLLGILN